MELTNGILGDMLKICCEMGVCWGLCYQENSKNLENRPRKIFQ